MDGSHEILRALSAKYGFRYERQANRGLIPTLQKMIKEARGKYICLQASDDYWPLDKLEKQVPIMEEVSDIVASVGIGERVDERGRRLRTQRYFRQKNRLDCSFEDVFLGRVEIPAATAMIRGDYLRKKDRFNLAYQAEDFHLWLQILSQGKRITFLPEMLGYYRIHGHNVHRRKLWLAEQTFKVLELYKDHPSFEAAQKIWRLAMFSDLAVFNKWEALKRLAFFYYHDFTFYKRALKLLIPKSLWLLFAK
jgi:glycosyltransferase involved in cell wall biosynthesis